MPATFTDTAGRVWTVVVTTETLKRVRSVMAVDLMEFVEGTLMSKLMGDIVLLCDVLYLVCKPEADARGMTDAQFGESLDGDVLLAAEEALAEGLFRISHPSRREAARKAWDKAKTLRLRACQAAVVRLDDPELDRQLEAILTGSTTPSSPPPTRGDWSGSSPESSASMPGR